jgi:hypothetical protein
VHDRQNSRLSDKSERLSLNWPNARVNWRATGANGQTSRAPNPQSTIHNQH